MSVQDDVNKALSLLQALEDKDGKLSAIKKVPQPPLARSVRTCRGLLFQWSHKVGAVVGAESTKGFVVLHYGPGQWSAPCFVSSLSLSIGFTAGISEISSLVVLMSNKAVDRFKQSSQFNFAADFNLAVFPADIRSGVTEDLLADVGDAISFAVGKGVLVDWSLKGGQLSADDSKNSLVYGSKLEVGEILSPTRERPASFATLYEKLNSYEPSPTMEPSPTRMGQAQLV